MELNKIQSDKYYDFDKGVYNAISRMVDGLILFDVSIKIKEPFLNQIRRMVMINIYDNL